MRTTLKPLNIRKEIIIILTLMILVLTAYWQVQSYGFVNYDDPKYILSNYKIQSEIDLDSILYAFKDVHTGHWHPLTILSHMLDWQLFGDNAGGHHWTSVIIHILNTILLFIFFRYVTGAIWKSAFIAALFALHPLNVESVAWIAERKNVLSTFFWILTMLFYVWYVQLPGWKRYLPVFFCFALGLMSKSMLVTLPFVLLLLDYWPLNRMGINFQNDDQNETTSIIADKSRLFFLVLEKIPLLVLTIISIGLTFYAAQSVNTVTIGDILPLTARISNAIFSYAVYIRELFWPFDLAVFYPYTYIPIWRVSVAALLLAVITILAIRYYRKYPHFIVGWFWYLGTLVPVIGFVQVGGQSMADRYVYIPFIGIFLMIVWGMATMLKKQSPVKVLALFSGIVLSGLLVTTHFQVKYWKNTITLFEHALKVTQKNYVANYCFATELFLQNRLDEAIFYFNEAIKIDPERDLAFTGLGCALGKKGEINEAIVAFQRAIDLNPYSVDAHYNLSITLMQMNRVDEAIGEYRKAIQINSNNPILRNNFGNVLAAKGRYGEAALEYAEAVRIQPKNASAHNNLAMVLMWQGKVDEAEKHFREALRLHPEYANAHFNLANILKKKGLLHEADLHYREAIRINPEYKQ
jgi:tetratricopeptide (TPR) repeat protein